MKYDIAIAKGDGIGPEVIDGGIEVLNTIGKLFNHRFNYIEVSLGGCAYDVYGEPLPKETLKICKNAHAILFGAVGGPKWDGLPPSKRPEMAILGLRKELDLYANLRPGILYNTLKGLSPLRKDIVQGGFDIMLVRELTGGIYFGKKGTMETSVGKEAYDVGTYSEREIKRIARIAFDLAMKRNKVLTSVDKANVLECSRLWRQTVEGIAKEYPCVKLEHMYVDNMAMQLIRAPKRFDVILTSNLFGDILSDELSILTGSIGLLPSASLGAKQRGLYEPIHGSAPDVAGTDKANPIAAILSAALLLKHSCRLEDESKLIEKAVERTLRDGHRTMDIAEKGKEGIGTKQMTEIINMNILRLYSKIYPSMPTGK